MTRIERKAFYVGTWREDIVTDSTMRQIIARSHAEKGQKVKVKLSKESLALTKTVVLQESVVCSFPLPDVYFLTVNQRHPTCLLCIAADPVRKYIIVALRTRNEVEAQEVVSTFQALKENPSLNTGNVVLRRKDNGNWTLRDRSQHNANRHLEEIFRETVTVESDSVPQPNGSAGGYAPVLDGRVGQRNGVNHSGSQTRAPEDNQAQMAFIKHEMDHLSQELQELKFFVEKSGSISSATLNNNNTDKSRYVMSEVHAVGGPPVNGAIVSAHSDGGPYYLDGQAAVEVKDYRSQGQVRAYSNGSALPDKPILILPNDQASRQITVPELRDSSAARDYTQVPDYVVHRRVSREYVQVPDMTRKHSHAESTRSNTLRVQFEPESARRSHQRHHQFRTLRGKSGVPTTIVRPIEEIYGHGPVAMHVQPRHVVRHAGVRQQAVYVDGAPQGPVYVSHNGQAPAMYVAAPSPAGSVVRRRRSRPNSVHVMEGNELKVFRKKGHLHDELL